jgi:hypothetical protein
MATRNMLIIRDAGGEILAAHVEEPADSETQSYISPTEPQHTLDRVYEVPAEICDIADPVAFHRAITDHVGSGRANITRTSAAELEDVYRQILASRGEPDR